MRTGFVFGVLLFWAARAVAAEGSPPAPPPWRERLKQAIGRAAADNPEIAEMEAESRRRDIACRRRRRCPIRRSSWA